MCNPAKSTIRFGLFPRKNRGAHRFIRGNKDCFGGDSIGNVLHFFRDHNRRFPRGDGGDLTRSGLLRFVESAKVLMIATKKSISGLREVKKYGW